MEANNAFVTGEKVLNINILLHIISKIQLSISNFVKSYYRGEIGKPDSTVKQIK